MLDHVGDSHVTRGREHEIAVLFCDLRGFTRSTNIGSRSTPCFSCNRYFEIVGRAVEDYGGHQQVHR